MLLKNHSRLLMLASLFLYILLSCCSVYSTDDFVDQEAMSPLGTKRSREEALGRRNSYVRVALLEEQQVLRTVCDRIKKNKPKVRELELGHNLDGVLLIESLPHTAPFWLLGVKEIAKNGDDPCFSFTNSSTEIPRSALVFIKKDDRTFVVTFGNGYRLITQDVLDSTFGLRVALNSVKKGELTRFGKKTVGSPEKLSTDYSSSSSSIPTLTAPNETVASIQDRSFRGAGPYVSACYGKKLDEILDFLSNLYERSGKEDYKQTFPFVKFLTPIRDAAIKQRLHESLLQSTDWLVDLSTNDHATIAFRLSGGQDEHDFSVLSPAVHSRIQGILNRVDIKDKIRKLKEKTVTYVDSDESERSVSLYEHLSWDGTLDSRHYALQSGGWYEINKNYFQQINTYAEEHICPVSVLCPKKSKEDEGTYNERVVRTDPARFFLMDKRTVWADPEYKNSTVEVCDIVDTSIQSFIHVKDSTDSALLSHLFAQGSTAASCLKESGDFRCNVRLKFFKEEIIHSLKEVLDPTLKTFADKCPIQKFESEEEEKNSLTDTLKELYILTFSDNLKIKCDEGAIQRRKSLKIHTGSSFRDVLIELFENGFWESMRGAINKPFFKKEALGGNIERALLTSVQTKLGGAFNDTLKETIQVSYKKSSEQFDHFMTIQDFKASDYEIRYGILMEKSDDKRNLPIPLFSRIQFYDHGKKIEEMGYKVGLEFVRPERDSGSSSSSSGHSDTGEKVKKSRSSKNK